jgi:predicted ATPase
MYITSAEIKNIKSINALKWQLDEGEYAGWHVLIGDNGSGKSTFLRSLALALIGETEAQSLRQNWREWLPKHAQDGDIRLHILLDKAYDSDSTDTITHEYAFHLYRTSDRLNVISSYSYSDVDSQQETQYQGWFSSAYGPFRRFTGGENQYKKLYQSHPRLAAHLSIFGEDVALTEVVDWLRDLKFKQLEIKIEGDILSQITAFINQDGFLPNETKLVEVSSEGVFFNNSDGSLVSIDNLSDGYRSILSMTLELIRQMQIAYNTNDLFTEDGTQVKMPGVVLIDEIDSHLHPTWQLKIGRWFREHFPQIQFIVTTHSPLICQAADIGSVWRLPKPGTDEVFERIEGTALKRLLYGDIGEAYSTNAFDVTTTRSEKSKEMGEELAGLNTKEVFVALTNDEKNRQQELQTILPTKANTIKQGD